MRPRLYLVLTIVFLLSGLVFPFTASNYFYGSEEDVTVTSEDFTVEGTDYSIIYFDGEPTFLVEDGEVVENTDEIASTIYDYYIMTYYPSDEDVNELKNLILEYNISRNDGYDWKNKEEYICREIMFTDKRIEMYIDGELEKLWCHDDASCDLNAKLLFQAYHEYTGWNSYESALEPLESFSYASYGTDFILENISTKLDNMDEDTVVGTIEYIQESVPTLRDYANDIESNIFRTPRMDDEADRDACYLRCYALCPSFDLDENILDDLEDKADEVYDMLGPLANYETTSESIRDNTELRLAHYENKTTAAGYDAKFSPIEDDGLEVESFARNVTELVSNTSFSLKVDRLSELRTEIRSDISSNNFEGLDDDINEYDDLVAEVQESADGLYQIYNETLQDKMSAEKVLFEVGTRDLDPVGAESYEELKGRMAELEDEFDDASSPSEYEDLEANYSDIAGDAVALLGSSQSGGASTAIVFFRGFARNVNGGIAEFAETTEVTEVEEIPQNQVTTFGSFSLLVFISLSSIILLLFFYFIKVFGNSEARYVVITGFMLGLVAVGFFSAFLYVFMYKTSTDATMDEFLVDFQDRENVALVVETGLANAAEESSMKSCAQDLADIMEEHNKSVTIYYMESGGCRTASGSSMSEEDCSAEIGNADSAVYLNPSETIDEPVLQTTFVSKAEIYATSDYYTSCPISTVFK